MTSFDPKRTFADVWHTVEIARTRNCRSRFQPAAPAVLPWGVLPLTFAPMLRVMLFSTIDWLHITQMMPTLVIGEGVDAPADESAEIDEARAPVAGADGEGAGAIGPLAWAAAFILVSGVDLRDAERRTRAWRGGR